MARRRFYSTVVLAMVIAFFVLAGLLIAQSLLSLRGGFQFLSFIQRSRRRPPSGYQPFATVIVPCKGCNEDLEQHAINFLTQDYPDYQVVFAVASRDDPAHAYLCALAQRTHSDDSIRNFSITVAGYSETHGEKVNNLLAGLKAADSRAEVLAFADIDIQAEPGWLRALIGPLEDNATTLSTGFRWYLPGPGFVSRLRAAWDSSIATMMGDHPHNFAWGGSMAIRREEFARLRVAEEYWQGTVSDDYAITRAARKAGGSIRFEPRCLVASHADSGFADFLRWTNRQIIITRIYNARYWTLGLASYSLYGLTFAWGIAVIIVSAGIAHRIEAVVLLAAIMALGMGKGSLRAAAARELFPREDERWKRYGGCYWRLAPLVPWIMLFNFISAAFIRRIEWSGTVYELLSLNQLKIVRRTEP